MRIFSLELFLSFLELVYGRAREGTGTIELMPLAGTIFATCCVQQRRDAYKHEQQQRSEPICRLAGLTYDGASAEGAYMPLLVSRREFLAGMGAMGAATVVVSPSCYA